MLISILKITARKIRRNPGYFLITTIGLTVGLTSALLVFLWARYELTYDRYDPNNSRVFAVLMNEKVEGSIETSDETPVPLFEIARAIPEIESITRFENSRAVLKTDKREVLKRGAYVDSSYFSVFTPTIIAGSRKPLGSKNSVAISGSLSSLLFPNENPIGKIITVELKNDYLISAVFADFPQNSSLHNYDFLLPFASKVAEDEWQNYLIKLHDDNAKTDVEKKIDRAVAKVLGNKNTTSLLFPLTAWRLHWNFENGKVSGGRIVYLVIFIITAAFILIMACINYMNIATATASQRSKEIGVRKITGATQAALAQQFLSESFLITSAAAVISLALVFFLLPAFGQLTGVRLTFSLYDSSLWLALLAFVCFAGVAAGSYPAFLLSKMKPALTLKGGGGVPLTGAGLRRALVVFQFALSVTLIFCALVLRKQTDFLLHKDLGFDRRNIINLWISHDDKLPLNAFKSEVAAHTSIVGAAYCGASPIEVNGYAEVSWPNKKVQEPVMLNGVSTDHEMLDLLKFKFISGRNFSPAIASDSAAFVITESAARKLGFDNPVGEAITYTMFGEKEGKIIGVIADFQNEDIHAPMDPVIFQLTPEKFMNNLFVRYEDGKLDEALAHVKSVFNKFQPGVSLDYSFLDTDFENQFFRERLLGNLSLWSTIITVSIAGLGLLGLTMFTTQRRVKEIGLRKVLGASVVEVVLMLCRDFLKPVVISFFIAFPVAYLLADKFLEGYAFRVGLTPTLFIVVGGVMVIFVISFVSIQSVKAALRDPIDSLRNSE